jgi:CheY-like chemotaxis protein
LLEGKVHVESEKNIGSTFSIELPLEKTEIKNDPKESSASGSAFEEKNKQTFILIAEDDDTNFAVMEMLIKQATRSQVIRAVNGQEAIDICLQNKDIILVLMDIKMPVLDGLEATRQIKSKMPDLKIVAITAYAMSGDENMVRMAGCDDYIAKPVSVKELKAKLESHGVRMK